MEPTHLSQEIEAKEGLSHHAYMWSNFAFNATDEVQETFTLPEAPWVYYFKVMEASPWNDTLNEKLLHAEEAVASPWNDKLKKKLEHAEEIDFACRCKDLFGRYFIMGNTAQLSFNLSLWVNGNGKADARLIYVELAKEALLRLHTRTTDWRNDCAMLQQKVEKMFQQLFPEGLCA